MFSRLFGKSNKHSSGEGHGVRKVADWSFLGTDIHSHLIPGIDDGAQTVDDSIELIRRMQALGYKSLVTTPHIKSDHFPNTSVGILHGLDILHNALKDNGIYMPVRAAAEYYIDDHFIHLLETEPLLTITGNEVLVELSFLYEPMRFNDILFRIQTKGYKPILAHPERYLFYHDRKQIYKELKDRGCMLQLNLIALVGYYGKAVRSVAEMLLKEGLYDYCGTDMHHLQHAESMSKLLEHDIALKLQSYHFLNSRLTI